MKDILFICQGNLGRSQMAQAFYNHYTKNSNAISAGVKDVAKKYNYRPTPLIIKLMKEEGIDISTHKIKLLNEDMLKIVKKVIVFCNKEECPTFLSKYIDKVEFHRVEDPYNQSSNPGRKVRDSIKEEVLTLLSNNRKD